MVKVGEVDFQSGEPISQAHWLPCEIEYSGPGRVSEYFEVVSEGGGEASEEEKNSLTTTFRGRQLRGCAVPLETGFEGHVLEVDSSRSSLVDGEPVRTWKSVQKFQSINIFNHDIAVSDTDPPLRCLEWLGVASAVAAPIDPKEIDKKLV
ncbi:hypothetical protein BSKO_08806 [Bryopsis sp. KO-2023]|nr:hypothetical protein BSKO_08806 [Bryopsis sp. KO-2023]